MHLRRHTANSTTCPRGSTYIGLAGALAPPSETDACLAPCMDPNRVGFKTDHTCSKGAYSQGDVTACYCQQEILKLVGEQGPFKGAYLALTQLESVCGKMTL
jgi:hypothetical protein